MHENIEKVFVGFLLSLGSYCLIKGTVFAAAMISSDVPSILCSS